MVTPYRIVTGSTDRWEPADPDPDWTEWDPEDRSSPSLQEKRLAELFEGCDAGALLVSAVSADDWGGAEILLTADYTLQLFPASTSECVHSEHWRLFRPDTDEGHFVVNANGAAAHLY
jgi:hypothetical protein